MVNDKVTAPEEIEDEDEVYAPQWPDGTTITEDHKARLAMCVRDVLQKSTNPGVFEWEKDLDLSGVLCHSLIQNGAIDTIHEADIDEFALLFRAGIEWERRFHADNASHGAEALHKDQKVGLSF